MAAFQCIRQGDRVELLPVRTDTITGVLYTRLTDILRVFPGDSFFRVDGGVLYYLEDENKQEYEPKRIAHYPQHIIDVVAFAPTHAPSIAARVVAGIAVVALSAVAAPVVVPWATGTAASIATMGAKAFAAKAIAACYVKSVVVAGPATVLGMPTATTTIKVTAIIVGIAAFVAHERPNEPQEHE